MGNDFEKPNKPTRALVAERAGVSLSTVSCVLNNSRPFSPKTKEKVLSAVRELKYVPDVAARSMKTNKSYQFAAVIDDIANPMFSQLVCELEKEGIKHDYFLNICGGYADFEVYVNQLIARRIDGIYIAMKLDKVEQSLLDKLIDNGIRVVSGGGKNYKNYRSDVIYINIDMEKGMRGHFELLRSLGHAKVAYLSAFPENSKSDSRVRIFKKLAAEYMGDNSPFVFSKDTFKDTNIENGYILGREMLEASRDYTAVIVTNDMMALGFIKAMRACGLRCPEDISVLGIDNNMLSYVFEPSITTFGPDYTDYAKKIFELLYLPQAECGEYSVGVTQFVRESTGIAPPKT